MQDMLGGGTFGEMVWQFCLDLSAEVGQERYIGQRLGNAVGFPRIVLDHLGITESSQIEHLLLYQDPMRSCLDEAFDQVKRTLLRVSRHGH